VSTTLLSASIAREAGRLTDVSQEGTAMLAKLLPPTKNLTLILLVVVGCAALALLFYVTLAAFLSGSGLPLPIVPALVAILMLALWRLTDWARKLITIAIVILAIVVPIGTINPFFAMEVESPPPVGELAIGVYVPVAIGLLYAYLLGRYRSEFRKRFW
jgi:protein-S-isoprenylcysteine O-methyltransferase Ste14